MNPGTAFVEQITAESRAALSQLEQAEAVRPFVDWDLPIPQPYLGSGEIRLILIGQDPTVQREGSRRAIQTVLNLDKPGALRTYLEDLCHDLGLSLAENVYATNACKNFFVRRPTTIKKVEGVDVLEASAPVWLPVLKRELAQFPEATVISLGEPVLSILVRPGFPREVKYYWGYHEDWQQGKCTPMRPIAAGESTVGRVIFPFVHLRSPKFFRVKRSEYIAFIRQQSDLES
jgi:uracil-DNA glycosylase